MEREETNDYDDYDEKIVVVTLNGVLDTDPIHKAIHSGGVRIRTVDCEEPIVQVFII
jgi:sporulation-control protein spo0M